MQKKLPLQMRNNKGVGHGKRRPPRQKIDPYQIWFFSGTFYVIGFCHKRKEVRIFALDRIKMLHQTKDEFEVKEDFDFEDFVGPSFGVFQGEPVKVKHPAPRRGASETCLDNLPPLMGED